MRNRFEPKHQKKEETRTRKIRNTLGPPMCVYIQERKKEKYCSTGCKSEHSTHTYICTHTHL